MFDWLAAKLACRAQLLTLSVVSTGSASLGASATAYTRSAGSFVTDGFKVGMEVTPVSFVAATPKLITGVSALSMTVLDGLAADPETAGRILKVVTPDRAIENIDFTPTAGRWWIEEQFLPGPAPSRITTGAHSELEAFPMYVLNLYGVEGYGEAALYAVADAILNLFPPSSTLTLSNSDVLRVRGDPNGNAPYRGQLTHADPGWAVVTITIPFRIRTLNSI